MELNDMVTFDVGSDDAEARINEEWMGVQVDASCNTKGNRP